MAESRDRGVFGTSKERKEQMKDLKDSIASQDALVKSLKKGTAAYKEQQKILSKLKADIKQVNSFEEKRKETVTGFKDVQEKIYKDNARIRDLGNTISKQAMRQASINQDIGDYTQHINKNLQLAHELSEGISLEGRDLQDAYGVSGHKLAEMGGLLDGVAGSQDKVAQLSLSMAESYGDIGTEGFDMTSNIQALQEEKKALEARKAVIKESKLPEDFKKFLLAEIKATEDNIDAQAARGAELNRVSELTSAAQQEILGPLESYKGMLESMPLGGFISKHMQLDKVMGDFAEGTRKSLAAAFDSSNPMGFKMALGNIEKAGGKAIGAISQGFSQVNALFGGMLGPLLAIVGAIMLAKKVMEMFYGGTMETRKELGVTTAQAAKLQNTINTTAMEFQFLGVTAEDAKGIVTGIQDNMGGVGEVTRETVSGFASLNAHFGVSGEHATQLAASMQAVGSASTDAAISQLESVGHLARANGVAPAGIIADMASDMEFFSEFAQDGGKNIAMAAIGAKKLGISMSTVSKMSESLLSFEESINSQMEASMLTGRMINTDKARELALAGDLEGMQKEIVSQIGTQADFEAMNVVQRKAMAAAFGVSVSELSKMVVNQDKLNSMTDAEQKHRDYMAKVMEFAGKAFAGFLSIGKALLPVLAGIGVAMMVAFWTITAAVAGVTAIGMLFNELNKRVPMLGTFLGVVLGLVTAIKVQSMLAGKGLGGGMMAGAKNMASAAKDKLSGMMGGGKAAPNMPKSPTGGKGGGNPFGFVEKMDPKKVLAGAAAMLIVSAALFVTAKALQEFASVSWGDMGKAGVALLALVLVLAAVGAIMMSGVGAIAILAGAAAMLVIAASLLVLGVAIQAIGKGFDILASGLTNMFPIMSQLVSIAAPIMALGAAFGVLAIGLGAFAVAAMALLPALPVLMVLGGMAMGASMLLGGGGAKEENNVEVELKKQNEKLDTMISLLSEDGPIAENTKKGAQAGEGFIKSVIMA